MAQLLAALIIAGGAIWEGCLALFGLEIWLPPLVYWVSAATCLLLLACTVRSATSATDRVLRSFGLGVLGVYLLLFRSVELELGASSGLLQSRRAALLSSLWAGLPLGALACLIVVSLLGLLVFQLCMNAPSGRLSAASARFVGWATTALFLSFGLLAVVSYAAGSVAPWPE